MNVLISGFRSFLAVYDVVILVYFLLLCVVYAIKFTLATLEVLAHQKRRAYSGYGDLFASALTPAVTVICPAYNEEAGIVQCVHALLNLRYPDYRVIVINDGSTDGTLPQLRDAFRLRRVDCVYTPDIPTANVRGIYLSPEQPWLTVVDKCNGGKADALNAGINLTRTPLFCSVDADSVLEPDALLHTVKPFVEQPERVAAVGGIIGIANGARIEGGSVVSNRLPRNPLVRFQVLEYLRAYLTGCASGSRTNNLLIISGAFAVYRRDLVAAMGGYRTNIVGEDAELTTHLHRYLRERGTPYAIVAIPDLVCWTEAPETLRVLSRQRRRWHHGLAETLLAHRVLAFNPRYGGLGLTGYPYLLVIELCAPVIEALGYPLLVLSFLTGMLEWRVALLLFGVAASYGIFLSLGALVLDEVGYRYYPGWHDQARLSVTALLEVFGYRQFTVVWRLLGLWDMVSGRHMWGSMERRGLSKPAHSAA